MNRLSVKTFFIVLAILLPISVLIALVTGAVNIDFIDVLRTVFDKQRESTPASLIAFDIRFPRVLLAAIIGCILSVCGAAMQGLFRNPLADPSLIGVTAGASLGASLAIFFSVTLMGVGISLPFLSLGAFIGGILAVILVYHLATNNYGTSVATMLLAGIAISALTGSVTSLLEFYANNDVLRRISLWRMGGLDGADYFSVCIALLTAFLILAMLLRHSMALNALLLGESEAKHLGINTEALKRQVIVLVAAGIGVSVALAGTIAFVGLVVPHITRLLIGPDHRYLLPASALLGSILLVVADNLARVVLAPTELPVGLITALVGVPFFISLLKRRHVYGLS